MTPRQRLVNIIQRHVANPVMRAVPIQTLLETTGRKSGQQRNTPLFYVEDGADYIVVASNGGAAKAPAWWLNLQAGGPAAVDIRATHRAVTGSQVSDEDKPRLWEQLTSRYPGYNNYQKKTERVIPLVRLSPSA